MREIALEALGIVQLEGWMKRSSVADEMAYGGRLTAKAVCIILIRSRIIPESVAPFKPTTVESVVGVLGVLKTDAFDWARGAAVALALLGCTSSVLNINVCQ